MFKLDIFYVGGILFLPNQLTNRLKTRLISCRHEFVDGIPPVKNNTVTVIFKQSVHLLKRWF